MANERLVLVEQHGVRGELVLNRPDRRNALIGPLVQELHEGLDALIADDAVNVILIRGAGGTLCAGLDLDAFSADPSPPWREHFSSIWAGLHVAIYACPKLIVGVLEGAAIAAGSALALACDILIAGDAARFQVAEVKLGMAAPINVVWLEYKFGVARAMEFAAGGQRHSGRELVERGIATKSFPDDRVLSEARAYADLLAENRPGAVAAVKRTIRSLAGIEDFRGRIAAAQDAGRGTDAGPGRGLRGR
ncbi:MAG: enoyl-CoA hydratase/isomerase family protein [Dehalococcoidia bacterium]